MNTSLLPELPAGAIYLGLGRTFGTSLGSSFAGWTCSEGEVRWNYNGDLNGMSMSLNYCAMPDVALKLGILAADTGSKTFIVGCLGGGPNFKPYSSYELAEKEAERLSLLHPNNPFLIAEVHTEVTATLAISKK